MVFDSDRYHDAEIQLYNCYACNEKISEYYLQQFDNGLQVVCSHCYDLKKDYKRVQKQIEALA